MRKLLKIIFYSCIILTVLTTSVAHAYDPAEEAQKCSDKGGVYNEANNTCDTKNTAPVGPCGNNVPDRFSSLCKSSQGKNVPRAIQNVMIAILVIAAILSLFFLIWGGFKWVTSGGDKAKVDAARQTITAAIVGLILALLSFFILSLVLGFFGLSFQDLKLPPLPRS